VTRLRIGIDARELLGARTGVGRYLGELMSRWTCRLDASEREFLLYTPEPLEIAWPQTRVRVTPGGRGTWWEQTSLAAAVRADGADVFFAPAYTAPLRMRTPLAVTIHDVSFSRHPEWFRPRERARRQLLTRSTARRARAVITVSEFSKREIADLYGIPSARIHSIHNGFTTRAARPGISREPIVLFVGSIFNRRRVPDLIAAFALVARSIPEARLVIAGDNRTWPAENLPAVATAHGVADRVAIRHYVRDEELDSLYARASAFAFLSEYEGFGFTPLEALTAGVPVVALDTEVAQEIYGDAVTYVKRGAVKETADALIRLLTSRADADAQLARAPAVLARYSWATSAERTLAVLEEVARR
jgi:glycosyltransferase involved in cell wall biosynthesis